MFGLFIHPIHHRGASCFSSNPPRTLWESLERRRLMTVDGGPLVDPPPDPAVDNNPPQVVAVYANSTAWTPDFRARIEADHEGSSQFGFETQEMQLEGGQDVGGNRILPWINVNQLSIQFDENVSVQQDDLTITGENRDAYAVTAFAYDPTTFVATWTLDAPVSADIVHLRLDGTSATGVTDLAGNLLQGNCRDQAGDGGTSGDGAGDNGDNRGRDFCDDLAVLPGDVTRDGRVNALDLAAVRARLNTSTTNPGQGRAQYSIFADVNGDGRINSLDLAAVRARLNTRLPEPQNDSVAMGA